MRSFLLIALNIEAVLAKNSFCSSQNHLLFPFFRQPFFSYYVIKALPSNAESCEEQGDGKQNFVGQTTAKLWPFCPSVAETRKKIKMKDLNSAEEGDFPCKLR